MELISDLNSSTVTLFSQQSNNDLPAAIAPHPKKSSFEDIVDTGTINNPNECLASNNHDSLNEFENNTLFWVPAHLHPEINPKEFQEWLKNKKQAIMKTSNSLNRKKSTLSKRTTPQNLETTDNLEVKTNEEKNEILFRTAGNESYVVAPKVNFGLRRAARTISKKDQIKSSFTHNLTKFTRRANSVDQKMKDKSTDSSKLDNLINEIAITLDKNHLDLSKNDNNRENLQKSKNTSLRRSLSSNSTNETVEEKRKSRNFLWIFGNDANSNNTKTEKTKKVKETKSKPLTHKKEKKSINNSGSSNILSDGITSDVQIKVKNTKKQKSTQSSGLSFFSKNKTKKNAKQNKGQKTTLPIANQSALRFPFQIEQRLYALAQAKLYEPKRPLVQQVTLANLMTWYYKLTQKRIMDNKIKSNRKLPEITQNKEQKIESKEEENYKTTTGIKPRINSKYSEKKKQQEYNSDSDSDEAAENADNKMEPFLLESSSDDE